MPKTNDYTGATYAGMTGIVEHGAPLADGRRLSELDPELNLDGSLLEGEHPERDEEADPVDPSAPTDPEPQREVVPQTPGDEEGDKPSPHGGNSAASNRKTGNTSVKSGSNR